MKNLIIFFFILAIFSSCKKEVKNITPDVTEGTYDVTVYDKHNNIVSTLKGNAVFGVTNNGTQIRLDNPDSVQTSSIAPNALAHITFQLNYKLDAPATINLSDFAGYFSHGYYITDWLYETQTGDLKIVEVVEDKLLGEFTLTAISANNPNPKWGGRITIKGKFYARCNGYGC